MKKFIVCLSMFLLGAINVHVVYAAIIDTYSENFDKRQDDTTIDGVDSWSVAQGASGNALTQDSTTFTGSGKALEFVGAATSVNVSRSAAYGDLSPCWMEYIVKPGLGAQKRSIPSAKIAAVSFDYTGKIYAADGSSWQDTGRTFTTGEWYRVILKLDFKAHLYNVYIEPTAVPKTPFVADKENLNFIDSSINSLSQIGFEGVYSTKHTDDTYIDDLVVHFVDRLEIITAPQNLMVNQPSGPITVQLQNSSSAPQTAWRDITLELRSSSEKGEFSPDKDNWKPITQIIIPENAQGAAFYYKDSQQGKPIITLKEYPDRGWEEASQQERIVTQAAYFDVAVNSPQTAGEYFNLEIIAKDLAGEVNEFYAGEVEILTHYIWPAAGGAKITPQAASGFNKGRLKIEARYPDCGIIEIIVEDKNDSAKTGKSGEVLFIPAKFNVQAATPQVVSRAFPVSVTSLNSQGETCPNYQGPVEFSIIPVLPDKILGNISPLTINQGEFSRGYIEKMISFNRWGTLKIEVHDLNYPQKSGISNAVIFYPRYLLLKADVSSPERKFYYIGEDIKISVSSLDDLKNPIANYQGLIGINFTLGLVGLADEYQFIETDAGNKTFLARASTSGLYEVLAQDKASNLKSESLKLEVKEAILEVISTSASIGTTEVVVKLVDEKGNTVSSESQLGLTIELEEEHKDGSATSPALHKPVIFNKGVAKILVSDTQAETVTILPKSQYDFKIRKGTVKFTTLGKAGIGTLMWREIKE